MIDATGDRRLPFVLSIGLLLAGAILTLFLRPDRPLADDDALLPAISPEPGGRRADVVGIFPNEGARGASGRRTGPVGS